jgi:hypothetical protein
MNNKYAPPYIISALLFLSFLIIANIKPIHATDHKKPVMEPYQLTGKRMVFTNWFYVRPGHFDWLDENGESVYTSMSAKINERDAQFVYTDSPYGIRLFAEPGLREIPIIRTDKPWDKWGIRPVTLIHEDGKYRLWGNCYWDNLHAHNCYFESEDGKNWTKPNLGLIEFEGSTENNLMGKGVGLSIFIDPIAPKSERYKSMWHSKINSSEFEKYKNNREWSYYATELDKPMVHVLRGAVSEDGLTWRVLEDPLAIEHMDSQTIGYYDHGLEKYVIYSREHMVGSRAPGHSYPTLKFHQRVSRRAIGRIESENFRNFPLSQIIIETDSDMHPSDDFYTNCRTTIPGAPDHHMMFPAIYNVVDDESDIVVYSSYNGINWHKIPGPPVLETQPIGEPDGGFVLAHPNLVERPNGDWILPYVGYNVPHKYPRGAYRFEPGMLVWPKGRLAGIEATEVGAFATAAFVPPGKHLKINALTQRTGYIKIEVVDMEGNPIAGHTFDDCIPLFGDYHFSKVSWKESDDIGVGKDEAIMLRFQMKMAKIYGLEFE